MQLACCSVRQFSWFMAVSRPVKDSCSVSPAGALLVSSSDPGVKLTFPPDCTVETRSVTLQVGTTSGTVLHHVYIPFHGLRGVAWSLFLQVLEVSMSEVQTLCGDHQTAVSPLICLSQTPNMHFLQSVKVQIPLPPGVTGTPSVHIRALMVQVFRPS